MAKSPPIPPSPEHRPREQDYYVSEVDEVVPLGMAVCTHEAICVADVLDTMERQAIEARNSRPGRLRQHQGGKGTAISKRPKSAVMLLIYGARYKPDAYRAKIGRLAAKKSATIGPRAYRGVDQPKPEGGSSAADAARGMFGL